MPTSDHHNITAILTILTGIAPRRILDIGCGFGKYGTLMREYLDVWHERLEPSQWQTCLTGIEAFPRYRNPIHDYVYNQIHYGEAQEVLPGLGEFDVILIADVIEHLQKPVAIGLVEECFRHSPIVVISTPAEFYSQEAICNNPYEIHHHLWTEAEFPQDVFIHTISAVSCNIFVASREKLNSSVFNLTDPVDYIYLRSRKKLGQLGLPFSVGLRLLCRLLA